MGTRVVVAASRTPRHGDAPAAGHGGGGGSGGLQLGPDHERGEQHRGGERPHRALLLPTGERSAALPSPVFSPPLPPRRFPVLGGASPGGSGAGRLAPRRRLR